MAGLEADTSSYNQPLPVSPLETVKNIAGLQQQKLSIDQVKLDQANQGLNYMTRAMGALGPDAPKEAYIKAAADAVKMGLVPENQLHIFEAKAAAAPDSKSFYNEFMTTAADHQQQINYHLGQRVNVGNGQTETPAVTSVKPGFGVKPIGLPIQQQAPPTTSTVDENNQPRLLGPQPTQLPAGAVPGGNLPGQFSLPVERPAAAIPRVSGPTGPTVDKTAELPTDFANRFPKPAGAAVGPTPLFAEGKEAYTKAQLNAGARAQSIKPAIDALKLMPGLATGPGTEQFTSAVAALKAWGLTDIKPDSDPTVIRQEVNKKLAQYVGNNPNVSRSDASQALAEAGSPSAKVQILPALMNLTRDAIALDRVQILKPAAFKGQNYDSYIKHEGSFPQSIDQKALTLDLLPEAERDKLVTTMKNKYKKDPTDKEANRFLNTLKLAKEHNIYESNQ